jgi:hypothetical protein
LECFKFVLRVTNFWCYEFKVENTKTTLDVDFVKKKKGTAQSKRKIKEGKRENRNEICRADYFI